MAGQSFLVFQITKSMDDVPRLVTSSLARTWGDPVHRQLGSFGSTYRTSTIRKAEA